MSIMNDYTFSILAAERQREFEAERVNDRLVRLALGSRTAWWRRLLGAARRTGERTAPRPDVAPAPQRPVTPASVPCGD